MYAQRKKLQSKHISLNGFILNDPQGENNILPHPITLNVCTKSILRILSVQHYYRNASQKDMHKEINLSSSIASKLNSDIGHQTIQT